MLHISLLAMNRLNKTQLAIFISLMQSLLPKDLTIRNLFTFIAASIVPCGGRKTSPRNHHSADYIFWSFEIIDFIVSHFENRISLKPLLGGVARGAHFITGHEHTQ